MGWPRRRHGYGRLAPRSPVWTSPRSAFAEEPIRSAELVGFYVPMHTATRIATLLAGRVRKLNPRAHLCFFGLYAPVNESFLRKLGAETILGGEFEAGLLALVERVADNETPACRAPAARSR